MDLVNRSVGGVKLARQIIEPNVTATALDCRLLTSSHRRCKSRRLDTRRKHDRRGKKRSKQRQLRIGGNSFGKPYADPDQSHVFLGPGKGLRQQESKRRKRRIESRAIGG